MSFQFLEFSLYLNVISIPISVITIPNIIILFTFDFNTEQDKTKAIKIGRTYVIKITRFVLYELPNAIQKKRVPTTYVKNAATKIFSVPFLRLLIWLDIDFLFCKYNAPRIIKANIPKNIPSNATANIGLM